jgi:hypothetical protein
MEENNPKGRMQRIIELARAFLKGNISPLQVSRDITRLGLADLPCWDATGGAHGPLSALYGAADDQDDLHFLGNDIELWHIDVRERKRAAVLSAEGEWRASVTDACEALVRWGRGDS